MPNVMLYKGRDRFILRSICVHKKNPAQGIGPGGAKAAVLGEAIRGRGPGGWNPAD